jgi:CheY-like chemotaxis protein
MVIEDDPIVRLGLQAVLEDRGDAVILAVSATEALARLAAGAPAPDVIVADYRLRDGLFGTDAIRRVRDAVGRAVPAVLLTGEALSDLRAEADLQGLVVAGKPIGSQELGRVIDIAMGS